MYFGACRADEVAFESNGQGDFTRIAVPLLEQALTARPTSSSTTQVLAAFGDGRRQTPVLLPPYLVNQRLLTGRHLARPARPAPDEHPGTRYGAGEGGRQGAARRRGTDRELT